MYSLQYEKKFVITGLFDTKANISISNYMVLSPSECNNIKPTRLCKVLITQSVSSFHPTEVMGLGWPEEMLVNLSLIVIKCPGSSTAAQTCLIYTHAVMKYNVCLSRLNSMPTFNDSCCLLLGTFLLTG
jgi:hypothetical protein